MKYRIDPKVTASVAGSIFLTGATRSGTTMMGQLLASFDDLEFFHEPPLVYLLIPLIGEMDEQTWRILFETYLFEDNHMLAFPGRRLNFNRGDDSSVYNSKAQAEIDRRTARTMRRTEILPHALGRRFCFKMPEMLPFVPRLRAYYPGLETIVMLRRPEGVVTSLLAKGWYSDAALRETTGEWLFRNDSELRVPYWLSDVMVRRWTDMTEIERCCFCYSNQYRYTVGRTDCLVIDYDDFVTAPHRKLAALAERLNLQFGPLTENLLNAVTVAPSRRSVSLESARSEFTKPVQEVYAAMLELSTKL